LNEHVGYSDSARGKIEVSSARSLEGQGYSGGTAPARPEVLASLELRLPTNPTAPPVVGSRVTLSEDLTTATVSAIRTVDASGLNAPAETPAAVAGGAVHTSRHGGRGQSDSAAGQVPSGGRRLADLGDAGSPAPSTPVPARTAASGPVDRTTTTASGDDFFAVLGQQAAEEKRKDVRLARLAAGDDDSSVSYEEDQLIPAQKAKTWQELTPAEQAGRIQLRAESIYRDCFPRPNERPRDMFFRFWGDNPFEVTQLDK
jgi:hypothetical protein